jgi:hypothetical protein
MEDEIARLEKSYLLLVGYQLFILATVAVVFYYSFQG